MKEAEWILGRPLRTGRRAANIKPPITRAAVIAAGIVDNIPGSGVETQESYRLGIGRVRLGRRCEISEITEPTRGTDIVNPPREGKADTIPSPTDDQIGFVFANISPR